MTTKIQGEFLAPGIISDQTQVSAASADHVLIFDASDNSLKKALVSTITDSGTTAADDITAGDAAVTISTSSGNITIDNGSSDDDIIFKGTDGGSDITALTLDMSNSGDAVFRRQITCREAIYINTADNSATTAYIYDSSGDFVLRSFTQDKDIVFKGNDGGSIIDALKLDMSEAGGATFNSNITLHDNKGVYFGAGSDLIISSDGTDATLDASGDITIDAGGEHIRFKDDGTERGNIDLGSANFTLRVTTSDNDMIFRGNDGGTDFTALTLDMSEAGAATFNNNVTAYSDERLKSNVETLEDNSLAKVEQLRGVTYTRDEKENIGVIAQEVEKILPEIVLTADDEMGTKSVDYSRLTAVLIEAVKDLSARVKELESK